MNSEKASPWGRQKTNFAVADYIQKLTLLNSEQDEIKGIQIEWKEVRVADECVRILLRLQTLTNLIQAAGEGKITMGETQCHRSCPKEGSEGIRDFFGRIKTGRLVINTEAHPCMRRACTALEALRKTRLGEMQSKGAERKAHMAAFGRATPEAKAELINEKMENMFDTAAKIAGLTKKQYREWRKSEALEPKRENSRGRSVSKGRKRNARSQEKREAEQKRIDKERKEAEEKRRQQREGERVQERDAKREEKKKEDPPNKPQEKTQPPEEREVEENSGSTEDAETTATTASMGKKATPPEESERQQRKDTAKGIPWAKRNTGIIY